MSRRARRLRENGGVWLKSSQRCEKLNGIALAEHREHHHQPLTADQMTKGGARLLQRGGVVPAIEDDPWFGGDYLQASRPARLPEATADVVLGDLHAKCPLHLDIPITIAGMSFGALSGPAKEALGRAATDVGTSTTTGDGGMTPEERSQSKRLVYQYLPSRYGMNPDDLRKAEQAAQAAGIASEQSPRVMQLREKLKDGADLDALADEVLPTVSGSGRVGDGENGEVTRSGAEVKLHAQLCEQGFHFRLCVQVACAPS